MRSRSISNVVRGVCVALVSLAAASAQAQVQNVYNGTNCIGQTNGDQANLTISGSTITAKQQAIVVCPVPKLTSGPGIIDDDITSIAVTVSGAVTCTLQIAESAIFGTTASNLWYEDTESPVKNTVTFNEPGIDDYWTALVAEKDWLYAQFFCTVPAKAQIQKYWVHEAGQSQVGSGKGYAILPPSWCRPDSANTDGWIIPEAVFDGVINGTNVGQSGDYVESAGPSGGGNGKFVWDCPRYTGNGSYIQIALGPGVDPGDQMGCNLNTDHSTTDKTWKAVMGSEFPDQEIDPVQYAEHLTCQTTDTDGHGDGKIVSYRTAWSATELPFFPGD